MRDCDSPNKRDKKLFEQPVLQTIQMFIGEMGCWLIVGLIRLYQKYTSKASLASEGGYQPVGSSEHETGVVDAEGERIHENGDVEDLQPITKVMSKNDERIPLTGKRVLLLALPAICDIIGTTLMNVGLLFVVPSIYQMTRGALVLFVGLFSVIFLKRKLYLYQWFALFTVVLGVAIVGLAGALFKDHKAAASSIELVKNAVVRQVTEMAQYPDTLRTIIGICLIAGAQIFTAFQFVLEEFILENYALEPLKVVGWEGIFGFTLTATAMVIMYFAVGRTEAGRYGYWDAKEGWRQLTQYRPIGVSSVLIMISIGYVFSFLFVFAHCNETILTQTVASISSASQ